MVRVGALSEESAPWLSSIVPEYVVDLYSGGAISRLDGEFPRFAGQQILLAHLCPESAYLLALTGLWTTSGVRAAGGEGQGGDYSCKVVCTAILGPLGLDRLL